jgi:hypothetical protein
LEAASWDSALKHLAEQSPGTMISKMPIIHFLPFEVRHEIVKANFSPSVLALDADNDQVSIKGDTPQQSMKRMKIKLKVAASKEQTQSLGFEGEADTDLNNTGIY